MAQVINADNAVAELKQIESRVDFCSIDLEGSVRYNGSELAEKNIRNYLKGNNDIEEDELFDFRTFDDFSEFQKAVVSTIKLHPDDTFAVTGLLCDDAEKYTKEGNPDSIFYTEWGFKAECRWLPYVRDKDYLRSPSGLWVGTWWMPGLDADYTAVIVGGDAVRTDDGIVGVPRQSKHYRMLISVAKRLNFPEDLYARKADAKRSADNFASVRNILDYIDKPENAGQKNKFTELFSKLLRNNYYIMMTRARKGCFVYFANDTVGQKQPKRKGFNAKI